MNKIGIVQALSDSAPPPERLRATMELQQQISGLTEQVQQLGQMLMQWAQGSSDLSRQQQTQMLDLAVLLEPIMPSLEPITPALEAIQQQQLAQDQRLAKIEGALIRITMALPPLRPSQDGQPPVQPRLASREQLVALPAKVLEALEAGRSPTPKKA